MTRRITRTQRLQQRTAKAVREIQGQRRLRAEFHRLISEGKIAEATAFAKEHGL